jgi:aspartate carbamoyltransferase catalytic subunit
VINAGWGHSSHPTQALLDIQTLFSKWKAIHSKRLLFIGDIRHSRVFSSHLELGQKLGYELGFLGPKQWNHPDFQGECFSSLDPALSWADAVVALRVQSERHDSISSGLETSWGIDYFDQYGLNLDRMKLMNKNSFLLHPGPVNFGTELDRDVLNDSRTLIFEQVANGVIAREKLLKKIFLN